MTNIVDLAEGTLIEFETESDLHGEGTEFRCRIEVAEDPEPLGLKNAEVQKVLSGHYPDATGDDGDLEGFRFSSVLRRGEWQDPAVEGVYWNGHEYLLTQSVAVTSITPLGGPGEYEEEGA